MYPDKSEKIRKISQETAVLLPFHQPLNPVHFTKEMILRATQARQLHEFLCHPNDTALKSALDQGTFGQYSHLTSADVDLMTQFFGSCTSCRTGKFHYTDLHVSSTTTPSTIVGQQVFFDLQLLTVPSRGGNSQAIIFIDDFSRFMVVLGAKSKTHQDVLSCITELIALYNAHGHFVLGFCSDSEAICQSLATPLGLLKAKISHTTPDSHCHKVERAIQQMDQKVIAQLSSLPYILPGNLILNAKKACADAMNLTPSSTLSSLTTPFKLFYGTKPILNSDPTKALLPFGATCLVKYTDGQRFYLASKNNLNINNVPKAGIAVNLGFSPSHPGDNLFYMPSSAALLPRHAFDIISVIPFNWSPQQVVQQTYTTTQSPRYADIIQNDDYPQASKAINQSSSVNSSAPDIPVDIHDSNLENESAADDSNLKNDSNPDPENMKNDSNLDNADILHPPSTRPTRPHTIPSRFALISNTTPNTLTISTSEKAEFSIKKALLMENYKHAVLPAINKELTKMFLTYKALVFVDQSDIPSNAIFYRFFLFIKLKFFPDHTFDKMSARLCAMENLVTRRDPDPETAFAATGDHHLFLLSVNAFIADATAQGILHLIGLWRYDIPAAFLQKELTEENCPRPLYGKLPSDLPPPYNDRFVKLQRGVYGTRVANRIFDQDHTAFLLSLGYVNFVADPRKFLHVNKEDTRLKILINTHVDDGGAVFTDKAKWLETLHYLDLRYPGGLDVSPMDRYLGMGFKFNPETGALTVSMLHSILKILATCSTETLPPQRAPYSMDLFDVTTDPTPIDSLSYQQTVGQLIYILKIRSEILLAVIMAATHNHSPTKGDLVKLIRILAYLKSCPELGPTFLANEVVLIAACDAAFAVHPESAGSHFSISFRIGQDSAPFHHISKIQRSKISINAMHSEYTAISITTEWIKFYRSYLLWLGNPQLAPTVLETDSASCISTIEAPTFPKNCKNLLVENRNVRDAYAEGIIRPIHVASKSFMMDLNAKPTDPTDFRRKRATLLNISANPDFGKYL